jgi:hypothetical protein
MGMILGGTQMGTGAGPRGSGCGSIGGRSRPLPRLMAPGGAALGWGRARERSLCVAVTIRDSRGKRSGVWIARGSPRGSASPTCCAAAGTRARKNFSSASAQPPSWVTPRPATWVTLLSSRWSISEAAFSVALSGRARSCEMCPLAATPERSAEGSGTPMTSQTFASSGSATPRTLRSSGTGSRGSRCACRKRSRSSGQARFT